MSGKRSVKLKTNYDVSRLLAKTINEVRREEIDLDKAAKIGYLANILLRSLEASDLQKRIEELEKRIEEKE